MDNTEIYSKRYTSSDKNALVSYIAKAYPSRKDLSSFIVFTLSYMPLGGEEMSLLIYRGQEIIGANMFLRTKVGSVAKSKVSFGRMTRRFWMTIARQMRELLFVESYSRLRTFLELDCLRYRLSFKDGCAPSLSLSLWHLYGLTDICFDIFLCPFSLRHGGLL